MKRKQHTCRCSAYPFPHRFGGGKCNGRQIAEKYFENTWGGGECKTCPCLCKITMKIGRELHCQVIDGLEDAKYGNCIQEHLRILDLWNNLLKD